MCSLANEGNIKQETNRIRGPLTQLINAAVSCSYSKKQEAMWLTLTGITATTTVLVDR